MRSASHTSSSLSPSPAGSSVDMRRASSHWSSRNSSGQGVVKVKTRYSAASRAVATTWRSSCDQVGTEWDGEVAAVAGQGGHEADPSGERLTGMPPGRRHRDVHDGVERAPPLGGRQRLHALHDGAARPPPAVLGMHAHGDLCAVQVVAQRELHHADPDHRPPVLRRRELDEAAVVATVVGKGPDLAQVEAAPVGPGVTLDRGQHGVPRRQALVVAGIELPHLHRLTLPRGRPAAAAQRRTAPNSFSTASMQRARRAPTSSSVSVRSGAQKRRR